MQPHTHIPPGTRLLFKVNRLQTLANLLSYTPWELYDFLYDDYAMRNEPARVIREWVAQKEHGSVRHNANIPAKHEGDMFVPFIASKRRWADVR